MEEGRGSIYKLGWRWNPAKKGEIMGSVVMDRLVGGAGGGNGREGGKMWRVGRGRREIRDGTGGGTMQG